MPKETRNLAGSLLVDWIYIDAQGNKSKVLVNDKNEGVGTATMAMDGSYSVLLNINGDHHVDLMNTIRVDLSEAIIINKHGLELWRDWLEGINQLCVAGKTLGIMGNFNGKKGTYPGCGMHNGIPEGFPGLSPSSDDTAGNTYDPTKKLCDALADGKPIHRNFLEGVMDGERASEIGQSNDGYIGRYMSCIGRCQADQIRVRATMRAPNPSVEPVSVCLGTCASASLETCGSSCEAAPQIQIQTPDPSTGASGSNPVDAQGRRLFDSVGNDGILDSVDTDGDGVPDASYDPSEDPSSPSPGDDDAWVDPDDSVDIGIREMREFCDAIQRKRSIKLDDIYNELAGVAEDCDDPFINPSPAPTVTADSDTTSRCLMTPERSDLRSLLERQEQACESGPTEFPVEPEGNQRCKGQKFHRNGVTIGVAYGTLLGVDFCSPLICQRPLGILKDRFQLRQ